MGCTPAVVPRRSAISYQQAYNLKEGPHESVCLSRLPCLVLVCGKGMLPWRAPTNWLSHVANAQSASGVLFPPLATKTRVLYTTTIYITAHITTESRPMLTTANVHEL